MAGCGVVRVKMYFGIVPVDEARESCCVHKSAWEAELSICKDAWPGTLCSGESLGLSDKARLWAD
jgi:hypothetical protein